MGDSDNVSDERARQLYDLISERGRLVVTGVKGFHALKKALDHAIHKAGLVIEWDPSTPATIRERLGIMSLSALKWSFAGGALGLIVGACTGRPGLWAGIGAGTAGILGGYQGHCAAQSGWRLRGYRDEDGVEHVEVMVRALPSDS